MDLVIIFSFLGLNQCGGAPVYILRVTSLLEMLEANRKRKTCRLRTKTSRRRRRGGKNWWKKSFFTANCLKSWFFVRLTIGIYRCVTHIYTVEKTIGLFFVLAHML